MVGANSALQSLDQRTVGLEMELDAIDRTADAESLELGHVACGKVRRAGREREGVLVPVEDRAAGTEAGEDRVIATGLGRAHLAPAEFDRASEDVRAAPGTSDELRAKADAEDGPVASPKPRISARRSGNQGQAPSASAFCSPPRMTTPS